MSAHSPRPSTPPSCHVRPELTVWWQRWLAAIYAHTRFPNLSERVWYRRWRGGYWVQWLPTDALFPGGGDPDNALWSRSRPGLIQIVVLAEEEWPTYTPDGYAGDEVRS